MKSEFELYMETGMVGAYQPDHLCISGHGIF